MLTRNDQEKAFKAYETIKKMEYLRKEKEYRRCSKSYGDDDVLTILAEKEYWAAFKAWTTVQDFKELLEFN